MVEKVVRRSYESKLTENQVRFIRTHPEIPAVQLAKLYGVGAEAIRRARRGETWGHVLANLDVPEAHSAQPLSPGELEKSLEKVVGGLEELEEDPITKEILKKYSGDR